MTGFRVGELVVVTDGKNRFVRKIDGIRKGSIRVGCYLFDWCGNEIDCHSPMYRIFPFDNSDSGNNKNIF